MNQNQGDDDDLIQEDDIFQFDGDFKQTHQLNLETGKYDKITSPKNVSTNIIYDVRQVCPFESSCKPDFPAGLYFQIMC